MFALIPLLACGLDTGTDAPTTDDSGEHPVEYGDITLSTSAIDFGYVAVGEWDTEELVITNGGADAIDLLGANIDDAAFSLDVTSGTIEPGDDLVVTVTFEPTTSVDYDGTLSLETTQEDIITVGLTGTAREQDDTGPSDGGSYLDVSWRSHDFGEVDIGKGEVLDLSLSNTGDESLLLVDFASTDASVLDWGKELTLPYVLAPGDTKDVTVLFTPQAEQTYNETLTVQSDADNEADLDLTITGTGFYGCSICSPLISVNTGGTDERVPADGLQLLGVRLQRQDDGQPLGLPAPRGHLQRDGLLPARHGRADHHLERSLRVQLHRQPHGHGDRRLSGVAASPWLRYTRPAQT
jgi:hypothetical protein